MYIETEHAEVIGKWQSRYRIEINFTANASFLPEQFDIQEVETPKRRRRRPSRKRKSAAKKAAAQNPPAETAAARSKA
jgi:hypothetical protein